MSEIDTELEAGVDTASLAPDQALDNGKEEVAQVEHDEAVDAADNADTQEQEDSSADADSKSNDEDSAKEASQDAQETSSPSATLSVPKPGLNVDDSMDLRLGMPMGLTPGIVQPMDGQAAENAESLANDEAQEGSQESADAGTDESNLVLDKTVVRVSSKEPDDNDKLMLSYGEASPKIFAATLAMDVQPNIRTQYSRRVSVNEPSSDVLPHAGVLMGGSSIVDQNTIKELKEKVKNLKDNQEKLRTDLKNVLDENIKLNGELSTLYGENASLNKELTTLKSNSQSAPSATGALGALPALDGAADSADSSSSSFPPLGGLPPLGSLPPLGAPSDSSSSSSLPPLGGLPPLGSLPPLGGDASNSAASSPSLPPLGGLAPLGGSSENKAEDDAKAKANEATISEQNAQIASLKQELATIRKELSQANKDLEQAQYDTQEKLDAQQSKLSEEHEKALNALQEQFVEQLNKIQSNIGEGKEEGAGSNNASASSDELKKLQDELTSTKDKLHRIYEELDANSAEFTALSDSRDQLLAKNYDLMAELEEAKKKIASLEQGTGVSSSSTQEQAPVADPQSAPAPAKKEVTLPPLLDADENEALEDDGSEKSLF